MNDKSKAIFLDRDGVLNKKRNNYVKTVSELEIFPFIIKPIKKLQNAGFKIVIITNQSAINRGLITHEEVKKIHQKLEKFLKRDDISIDGIYYCPHRPDEGCSCRKPKFRLLHNAISELNIDVKSSWFIGDSETDIEAGKSIGCKTLLVTSELNLEQCIDNIL